MHYALFMRSYVFNLKLDFTKITRLPVTCSIFVWSIFFYHHILAQILFGQKHFCLNTIDQISNLKNIKK